MPQTNKLSNERINTNTNFIKDNLTPMAWEDRKACHTIISFLKQYYSYKTLAKLLNYHNLHSLHIDYVGRRKSTNREIVRHYNCQLKDKMFHFLNEPFNSHLL